MFYTTITEIKKRSGDVVPFATDKIYIAITKAYKAVAGQDNDALITEVTKAVMQSLDEKFTDRIPSVEEVQNTVEQELMAKGLFDVAKNYIIYRYEHTKEREEKKLATLEKLVTEGIQVTKRDGRTEQFSTEKLRKTLQYWTLGYENDIDIDGIIKQVGMEVHEDITTDDIERVLIMALRSFIEQDPAYSYVASKALISRLHKQVIGADEIDFNNLENQLKAQLRKSIEGSVAIGALHPKMLLFDLDKLAQHLKMERDNNLTYLGAQTLNSRYFTTDPVTKKIYETPQLFWMRVAMGLSLNEVDKEAAAIEFYDIMSTLHFVPSTPTLLNAG